MQTTQLIHLFFWDLTAGTAQQLRHSYLPQINLAAEARHWGLPPYWAITTNSLDLAATTILYEALWTIKSVKYCYFNLLAKAFFITLHPCLPQTAAQGHVSLPTITMWASTNPIGTRHPCHYHKSLVPVIALGWPQGCHQTRQYYVHAESEHIWALFELTHQIWQIFQMIFSDKTLAVWAQLSCIVLADHKKEQNQGDVRDHVYLNNRVERSCQN